MRRSAPRPLQQLLTASGDGRLLSLYRESVRLAALQAVLRDYLGAPLADHLRLVRADPGAIVVETESPAWASRLRYQSSAILATLVRTAGLASRQVIIRISSGYATPPFKEPLGRTVPTVVAQQLLRTADHIRDPDLAAALRRLARHTPVSQS